MSKLVEQSSVKDLKQKLIPPRHVGIILDGNRRWAKANNVPLLEGHEHGLQRVEEVVREAFRLGSEVVSLFVFSSENWRRSPQEVNYLMKLFLRYFKQESHRLLKDGFRLRIAGQINRHLRRDVKSAIKDVEKRSAQNTGPIIVLCFNYGGQTEILDMVKSIVKKGLGVRNIDLKTLQAELYNPDVPDLDLIIRTSGEQRLSGFQLWRAAYAEMIFVDKYWPDFRPADLRKAFKLYYKRQRRFGGS